MNFTFYSFHSPIFFLDMPPFKGIFFFVSRQASIFVRRNYLPKLPSTSFLNISRRCALSFSSPFSTESEAHSTNNPVSLPSTTNEANANNQQQKKGRPEKRKRNRHKRPLTMLHKHKNMMNPEVNCIPLAESLDIDSLQKDDQFTSRYEINHVEGVNADKIAIHCVDRMSKKEKARGFFVFAEGVVVFWDIDRNTQSYIIDHLKKHQENPIPEELKNVEEETMEMDYVEGSSYANNDTIFLNSEHQQGANAMLTKFAFSHAMAASVKLGIWEQMLEKLDDEILDCIDGLKNSHRRRFKQLRWVSTIPWNHKKALLMIDRHLANSTDLMSKDIYWDLPETESSYGSLARRLKLNNRRNDINERLGYSEYFCKTISDALNTDLSHKLEWIIILLIAFECIHIAYRWYRESEAEEKEEEGDDNPENLTS